MANENEKYCPPFTLNSRIVNLVADISSLVGQIIVIEDMAGSLRLRRQSRIKTIQSSLAIENNTLTVEQVTAVLNGKHVLAPRNEIQEVISANRAYEIMPSLDPFSIQGLLKAHSLMLEGLKEDAGCFRAGEVGVFAGDRVVHMAPPASLVWSNMQNLFDWLKGTDFHPLISSSLFHYELEFIHPFSDGNGRMGRYWQTLLLSRWKATFAWLPVETVIKSRQSEYYQALGEAKASGSGTSFVEFMLVAILTALQEYLASDQDNDQVSDQVRSLLFALGDKTLSAYELMEIIGVSHRTNFRRNYLAPALLQNLIEQTVPDKPNSRNQKYRKKTKK